MCIKRMQQDITSEDAWKLLEKDDIPQQSEADKEMTEIADGLFGDLDTTEGPIEQPKAPIEQPDAPIEVPSEQPEAPIEVPSETILDPDTQLVPVGKEKCMCAKCKYFFERAPNKRENCCDKCNAKRASLSRHFGSWPIPQFDLFNEDQQTNFWRFPSSKLKDLEFRLVQQATEISIKENSTSKQGEYLPLSVYAARGFPAQMILQNCKDFIEHDVLGRCYKVNNSLEHA